MKQNSMYMTTSRLEDHTTEMNSHATEEMNSHATNRNKSHLFLKNYYGKTQKTRKLMLDLL